MNAKKGFAPIVLLIIIAVVAIGGGAYYFSQKDNAPKEDKTTETNDVSTVTTTVTASSSVKTDTKPATINTTAGWKIYTNPELGFSVEYNSAIGQPTTKASPGTTTSDGISTKPSTTITFGQYEIYIGEQHVDKSGNLNIFASGELFGKPLTFQEITANLTSKASSGYPEVSNVTINGTNAVWAEWGYRCPCKDFAVYMPYKDTRVVLITAEELGDEESGVKAEAKYKDFEKFAKSFKFTK